MVYNVNGYYDRFFGFLNDMLAQDFCRQLEAAGLSVIFQDERLSTVAAEDALIEGGMSRSDRKQYVDKVAAAVILQQWLDNKQQEG